MVNDVTLIGNVGGPPEIFGASSKVASLSVATSRSWKDKDDNWQEETEWHSVKCFGRLAESVEKNISKGQQVYVSGHLKTEKWEQEGQKRSKVVVIADKIRRLGARSDNPGPVTDPGPAPFPEAETDDLPF